MIRRKYFLTGGAWDAAGCGRFLLCLFVGTVSMLATPMSWASVDEKGGGLGIGASTMGMAGTQAAIQDENALWWNPAFLGALGLPQVSTSVGSIYTDRRRSFALGGGYPLNSGAVIGAGWLRTAQPGAQPIDLDSLLLAGSLPLLKGQDLFLGTGVKFIFGSGPAGSGRFLGSGLDLGIFYRTTMNDQGHALVLGASVMDLDTRIEWSAGQAEVLPRSWTLGGAYRFDRHTQVALDLEQVDPSGSGQSPARLLRLGAEHHLFDFAALRAGWMLDDRRLNAVCAGVGLHWKGWSADYALTSAVADLGWSHRLSLGYTLPPVTAAKEPARTAATPAPSPTPTPLPPAQIVVGLIARPAAFSPNEDGNADTTQLVPEWRQGDRNSPASWRLLLENAQGVQVRAFTGQGRPYGVVWDGRDESQIVCPDGTYRAQLIVADREGGTLASVQCEIIIKTTISPVEIKSGVSELAIIGGSPEQITEFKVRGGDQADGSAWKLSVQNEDGAEVYSAQGRVPVPETLFWSGLTRRKRTPAGGAYTARLILTDAAGNRSEGEDQMQVVLITPKVDLKIEPKIIKPGDTQYGRATFYLEVTPRTKVLSWSLAIRDAEKDRLILTQNGERTLPESWVWNGLDEKGRPVKGGMYFRCRLRVTFAGKKTLASPLRSLATDVNTADAGKALALHLTAVTFPADGSEISDEARKNILQAAETIKRYAKNYRVEIKGYTDADEAPGREVELSRRRAQNAETVLSKLGGIPATAIESIGYGSANPLTTEKTPDAQKRNRRAEVVLVIQK